MKNVRNFETYPVSSLEKVFGGKRPTLFQEKSTCFLKENISFQDKLLLESLFEPYPKGIFQARYSS